MLEGYVPLQVEGWAFLVVPELARADFAAACALPRGVCSGQISPVVSSVNTEVRRFVHHGRNYFLKEYFFLGWKKHLKLFRRGERLVRIAGQLREAGFLTPRVVGIGRCGGNRRVVTEAVENAADVWQVLFPDFRHHRGAVDDGFVHAFGCIVGDLHRCGFFHGDLRWRNILTRRDPDGWKFYFIDNDRTVCCRWGLPPGRRVKNLSQILFSGLLLGWPPAEWEAFLGGYAEKSGIPVATLNRLRKRAEDKAADRLADRRSRENSRNQGDDQ